MPPIWFVLGISGAGKSYFSRLAAERLSWLHYEVDLTPHDGINHWGFRDEWDVYFNQYDIAPFAEAVTNRSSQSGYSGSILSFPSNLIGCLDERHILAARQAAKLVVLTGPNACCLNSFLQREVASGRLFSASHWQKNNISLYNALGRPWIAQHVVNAFEPSGARTPFDSLLERVQSAT